MEMAVIGNKNALIQGVFIMLFNFYRDNQIES